jgi:uncharacterized repeat protein (TIGR03847 family)
MSELDPDDNSYDSVDVFTTGTIGRPGQRTFYLQVRIGHDHVDVKCEKIQVAAMAEHLRNVLQDLPPVRDRPLPGALEMTSPPHERFVLGQIGLGYDPRADQVVVQLEELGELDDEGDPIDDDLDRVRVHLSREQAADFCDHAESVVASGRPDCRWCGRPIDPDGHPCARMN